MRARGEPCRYEYIFRACHCLHCREQSWQHVQYINSAFLSTASHVRLVLLLESSLLCVSFLASLACSSYSSCSIAPEGVNRSLKRRCGRVKHANGSPGKTYRGRAKPPIPEDKRKKKRKTKRKEKSLLVLPFSAAMAALAGWRPLTTCPGCRATGRVTWVQADCPIGSAAITEHAR